MNLRKFEQVNLTVKKLKCFTKYKSVIIAEKMQI